MAAELLVEGLLNLLLYPVLRYPVVEVHYHPVGEAVVDGIEVVVVDVPLDLAGPDGLDVDGDRVCLPAALLDVEDGGGVAAALLLVEPVPFQVRHERGIDDHVLPPAGVPLLAVVEDGVLLVGADVPHVEPVHLRYAAVPSPDDLEGESPVYHVVPGQLLHDFVDAVPAGVHPAVREHRRLHVVAGNEVHRALYHRAECRDGRVQPVQEVRVDVPGTPLYHVPPGEARLHRKDGVDLYVRVQGREAHLHHVLIVRRTAHIRHCCNTQCMGQCIPRQSGIPATPSHLPG